MAKWQLLETGVEEASSLAYNLVNCGEISLAK
jgi:hypothetical protein